MNATLVYKEEVGSGYCVCLALSESRKIRVRTPYNIAGIQRAVAYLQSRGLTINTPYRHGADITSSDWNELDHTVI